MTDYLEVSLRLKPFEPWADVLCHELGGIGFESFTLEEPEVKAYIPVSDFNEAQLTELVQQFSEETEVSFTTKTIASKNWNEEWESNFHPVFIGKDIMVRAPFHDPVPGKTYDILVHPKMAFGTGHHPTTAMVMEAMLEIDFNGKSVLDVGTGTGILAILAEKRGSKDILAFDNDDWSVMNASENVKLNDCKYITVEKLTVQQVDRKPVNVILANINRNVILADLEAYVKLLESEGHLILSGFIGADMETVLQASAKLNFEEVSRKQSGEWCMLHLKKLKE